MNVTDPKQITMSCNDISVTETIKWDCNFWEVLNVFKKFMYALEFSPNVIEKCLNEYDSEEFIDKLYPA